MQIAGLINAGLSNKQIARQLDVGVATIKSHVHNLLSKLEVERRGQVMSRLASPPGWGGAAGQQQRPIRP
jgi:ATP/maltotriose-dependent transcriptional regulator MalT